MGTSPDVGGTRGLGRPQTMDYMEMQQTAQDYNAKQSLGAVKDTIHVPFEEMGRDVWKYKSDPSKPTLSTKVMRGVVHGETEGTEELEKERFEELMEGLNLQLSLSLKRDRKLPYRDRDPRMIVFEHVLKFVAKAEIWLESAALVDPSQNTEGRSKSLYFPARALRGWLEFSEAVSAELKATSRWLPKGGQMIRDARTNYLVLKKLGNIVKQILGEKEQTKLIEELFKELDGAKERIQTGEIHGITTMVAEMIDDLAGILASFRFKGIGTFIFGLDMAASSYLRGQKGNAYGPVLASALKLVAKGTQNTTAEQKRVIPRVLGTGVFLFTLFSLIASGFQVFAEKDDPRLEKESITSLALSLGTCLLAESEAIAKGMVRIFEALEIPSSDNALLVVIGDLFAMNLLPLNAAAGKNKMKTNEQFRRGMIGKTVERLLVLRQFLEENKEIDQELAAGVRQAGIAVKRNEAVGYFEAIQRIAQLYGWTIVLLQEDASEATSDILQTIRSFRKVEVATNFTRVISQAA